MAKRRLSEQQVARIRRIQERRRSKAEARAEAAAAQTDEEDLRIGLVVVRHGANLVVEDAGGRLHHCVTRQHIGHPVCGDRVVWQRSAQAVGVVTAIEPRTNVLSRPITGSADKPLAANIGLMAVVLAPYPRPTGFLLDQYLVAAERIGVAALIVCNKMDLLDDDERVAFLAELEHYMAIGYPVIPLSLKTDMPLTGLEAQISDRTAILVGQSGVGKSSLVRALLPQHKIAVGALSAATGLGRHTTSATTSYRLSSGGRLIDSPGVRSFRLGRIEQTELEQGFPEFRPYLRRCRFKNCGHDHEPGCAIRDASERGQISAARLLAFQQLSKATCRR
jgi:ribosome biogenesis GTPase